MTVDVSALPGLPYRDRIDGLYAYFDERRSQESAGPSAQAEVWEVFGHDEALRVLDDHVTFSNDFTGFIPPKHHQLAMAAMGNLSGSDEPRHRQLRLLVSQAFTPRTVQKLRPATERLVTALVDAAIDRAREGGPEHVTDLVHEVASPLSATVIAELFGIPETDQDRFWHFSDSLLGARPAGDLGLPDEQSMANRAAMVQEAAEYLFSHIRAKRADPSDDLTSGLCQAELDGERLTDEEIFGLVGMFLLGGHLPTSVLIGNTVMCLDEHPEALADLRRRPEGVAAAVEEVLRWRPPLVRDQRLTTRETKVGDHLVPARSMVVVWLASANRDETCFADAGAFDIRRTPNPHRAFGKGIHHCIGAALARLETNVAVSAILQRCPDLRVLREGGIEFHPSIGLLGPVRLPVRLSGTGTR